jgi:hypothetical protein
MNFIAIGCLLLAIVLGKTSELAQANSFKTYGGNLKALCKGKSIDFRNVGDLRNLIFKTTKDDAASCSETVIAALNELARITEDTNACSVQKAQAITQFYETYLRNSRGSEDYEKLPKPVIRFAIAYGMQLSHICKRHLVDAFMAQADKTLTKRDFKELGEWISEKGPVGRLLAPIKRPDEIILPSDLSAILPDDRVTGKLCIKAINSGKAIRLKEVCAKRFKPLYENSVIPLAILANSGIDYKQLSLIKDLKLRSKTVPKVALWSRIVFLCESLDAVNVLPAPSDGDQSEGAQPLEVMTEEELEGQAGGLALRGLLLTTDASSEARPSDLEQVEPYYPAVQIEDEIIGHMDLRLKSIIAVYDKKKTQAERIREKLLKRGWNLVLARFKYGELKALMRASVKQMRAKLTSRGQVELVNDELVDLLDAKDETKLFKAISGIARANVALARWAVVTLMRSVMGFVMAALVISGVNHDKVDQLNDNLRKYNQ